MSYVRYEAYKEREPHRQSGALSLGIKLTTLKPLSPIDPPSSELPLL